MTRTPLTILCCLALAAGLLAVLPARTALADTCTSAGSGNWSTLSWSGCTPTSDDDVVIAAGHTVTVDTSVTVHSLTISSGGALNMGSLNSPDHLAVLGDVTINGSLALSSGTANIYVGGNWTSPTGGTFANNGSFVIFNGGNNQVISGSPNGASRRFERIIVENNSTVTFNNLVDVESGLEVGAGSTFKTNGTANFNQPVADAGPLDCDGTCIFNNLTVRNLDASGSTGSIDVNGNFLINNATSNFTAPGPGVAFTIGGNFTNHITTGTFDANGGTITLDGAGPQSVGGGGNTTFHNLTVNNTSADTAGVSLGNNQTVNGTLTLTDGLLKVAAYDLTLGSGATVSGGTSATSMVVTDVDGTQTGRLCKVWGSGAFTYPIGDARGATEYTPVTFTPTDPSGLTVCFRVVDEKNPNVPPQVTNDYLTRYWVGDTIAGSFDSATGAFTFIDDASDVVGSTANMLPKKWEGGYPWVETSPMAAPTFNYDSLTSLGQFTAFKSGVLAVTLAEFYAEQVNDLVRVTWETAMELNNQGFNLYRGATPDSPERQLNEYMIPSQSIGSPTGFAYTWDDDDDLVAGTTYYYWLEDLDIHGATTLHGPASVAFAGPTAVRLGSLHAGPAPGTLAWPSVILLAGAAIALVLRRRRTS